MKGFKSLLIPFPRDYLKRLKKGEVLIDFTLVIVCIDHEELEKQYKLLFDSWATYNSTGTVGIDLGELSTQYRFLLSIKRTLSTSEIMHLFFINALMKGEFYAWKVYGEKLGWLVVSLDELSKNEVMKYVRKTRDILKQKIEKLGGVSDG